MESKALTQLDVLSHARRLAVFRLLVRRLPDGVPAGEIAQALNLKPSTASVYLSALHGAALVSQERRGTSLLYRANMESAQSLIGFLVGDCCNGRPDLADLCNPAVSADRRYNVLFLCTGNSARSIFAEAILRHEAPDRFDGFSAGAHPQPEINPFALEMLQSRGMDTSGLKPKSISAFQGADAPRFDFVFTVCDLAANEDCPAWTGQPVSAHWGLPDPVKATGSEAEKRLAFQQTFGAMRNRILAFASLPFAALDRASLQKHVDDIGATPETV